MSETSSSSTSPQPQTSTEERSIPNFKNYTVKQLKVYVKEHGHAKTMRGYSKMLKGQLVELLTKLESNEEIDFRPKERVANVWVKALKEWNGNKAEGTWCVPKKGSDEYKNILNIMDRLRLEEGGEQQNSSTSPPNNTNSTNDTNATGQYKFPRVSMNDFMSQINEYLGRPLKKLVREEHMPMLEYHGFGDDGDVNPLPEDYNAFLKYMMVVKLQKGHPIIKAIKASIKKDLPHYLKELRHVGVDTSAYE